MAIILEAINVVIKHESILKKYPNGELGFLADISSFEAPWHTDREVSRVGFFDPNEMHTYLRVLEQRGLVFTMDSTYDNCDFCIVDMISGPTKPCPWLGFGRQRIFENGSPIGKSIENYSFGWLANKSRQKIVCDSKSEFMLGIEKGWGFVTALKNINNTPESIIQTRLKELGLKDGKVEFINETGQTITNARPKFF
jgi:hypothetical protein